MKFMLQNSIMVAGEICSGSTEILSNFRSPISATAYEKCIAAGYEFAGFVNGLSLGIDSLFDCDDETDEAITAVLDGKCDCVLYNDVFGKISRQASKNGLYFISPAYGTVSRYGLMPAVSSADAIGVICKDIAVGTEVLTAISGHDAKDGTSLFAESYDYSSVAPVKLAKCACLAADVAAETVEIKYLDVAAEVYYILASAEICNNTNRFDGVKYGKRAEDANGINEIYLKTRTAGFEKNLQLASIVGCMVLSKDYYETYYNKAMQLRRVIRDYYYSLLDGVDAIALPTEKEGDKFAQSALYALAKLCGLAVVSLNVKGTPAQFICKTEKLGAVLALAKEVAQ